MSKSRKPKAKGETRVVVGQNVKRLMDRYYGSESNPTKKLSLDAHVSLSTVQRVVAGADPASPEQVGASIDTLEALARCLHVMPYQLLVPDLYVEPAPRPKKVPAPLYSVRFQPKPPPARSHAVAAAEARRHLRLAPALRQVRDK